MYNYLYDGLKLSQQIIFKNFMEIPEEVKNLIGTLEGNGFESYIVGGCVRDLLIIDRGINGKQKEPDDWDLATNARPEQIQDIFQKEGFKTFYENEFGTVGVVLPFDPERKFDNIVEITTYRTESSYINRRHPEKVNWAETIEQDLARRDFTINAIAIKIPASASASRQKSCLTTCLPAGRQTAGGRQAKLIVVDPFKGQDDLDRKTVRAVGNPEERFSEDALRMLRAVRFAATLGFKIEKETKQIITKNSCWLKDISWERIREELVKIIMSPRAAKGIELLREFKLLENIIPELEEGYGVEQNKHHIYDCYQHNLFSLDYAAKRNFNQRVRIAALLHDIAKPRVKNGKGSDATFYGHEIVGAKMVKSILERLKFPKEEIKKIVNLTRYHLFYYNVGEVSESSVRRLVRQAGKENMEELLQLRMCDRIGSGVPKAEPYKLRHLKYLIEKTSQDPVSVKKLEIDGREIMKILNISSGPKIGWILETLLGIVLDDPQKNDKKFLIKKTEELGKINDGKLYSLSQKTKKEVEMIETKKDEMTKRKYWVT